MPTVGWKRAPLSAVASRFGFLDKYSYTLCTRIEMVVECLCL
jgi:hypothetical protein